MITACDLEKTGNNTVIADGVEIEFDEEVGTIELIPNAAAESAAAERSGDRLPRLVERLL